MRVGLGVIELRRQLDDKATDTGARFVVADAAGRKTSPLETHIKTATGGNGYRHGKTQIMSQRRHREVAAP